MTSTSLFFVKNLETLKLFFQSGADVNERTHTGYTPLHMISQIGYSYGASQAEFSEMAQFLIDNGADVNVRDSCGQTPLHIVCTIEMMKLLIDNGADVNIKANNGETQLQPSMYRGERRLGNMYPEETDTNYMNHYIKQIQILKEKQNNIELRNELTNILLPFIKEKHLIKDILLMKFQIEFVKATKKS